MLVTLSSQETYFSQQSYSLSSNSQRPDSRNSGQPASPTDQLLNRLAERIPGMSQGEMKNLEADKFSPEKVAGRIAGFVQQGLERARREGKSEAEIQGLYDQALAGIEQGFDEARDILDDMNLLTDELATTIDQTYDLTMQELEGLAPAAATPTTEGSTRTSVLAAERYQQAESFSLKLKTQDGDSVVINFASASSYQSSFGGYSDGEGNSAVAFSIDRSESSSYQFQVEGDLDDDEITAIQNLIQDVSLIADDFFDGDVQAAFDQASQFQMDKSELASMNLTLTRSERYSAVGAYQQVQNPDASQNPGRKLGHMMNDLAGRFSSPDLGFLASAVDFGQDLLSSLIPQDSRYKQADSEQQSLFDQNLQNMKDILAGLTGGDGGDDD